MIDFRLHVVMAERKILRIKQLAEKTGLDTNTIAGIYHNRYKRVDLNTLNKLCQVLKCTPADLFEYTPEPVLKQAELPPPSPLPPLPQKSIPVKQAPPTKQTSPHYHDRLLEALKKSVYDGDHRELMELTEEEQAESAAKGK